MFPQVWYRVFGGLAIWNKQLQNTLEKIEPYNLNQYFSYFRGSQACKLIIEVQLIINLEEGRNNVGLLPEGGRIR
jgi:hypothetical protein